MIFSKIAGKLYNKFGNKSCAHQKTLTPLEEKIYNEGERLIPGVTHDILEVIRHRSSYEFFRIIIERDLELLERSQNSHVFSIVDLGCGVGHGCLVLSGLKNSHITGVDISQESIEYAKYHYSADNITYQIADLTKFISKMPEYDYVVSRGVFEHIPNGLQLALSSRWHYRLLFDVPYNEPTGPNPHHLITGIREINFVNFTDAELFYQDSSGIIYDARHKPQKPNMIICVCTDPDFPKAGSIKIDFPLPAWQPEQKRRESRRIF